jgi:hypothetical protein
LTRSYAIGASFVLLSLAANLYAQEGQNNDFKLSESKGSSWQAVAKPSNWLASNQANQSSGVILRYQLDLNFTDGLISNSHFYLGRERITWKPNGDSLVILDVIDLRVDSVLNESQRLAYDTQSSNGKLKIVLLPPMRIRDSLLIDIWYAHTSTRNIGYYDSAKYTGGTQQDHRAVRFALLVSMHQRSLSESAMHDKRDCSARVSCCVEWSAQTKNR